MVKISGSSYLLFATSVSNAGNGSLCKAHQPVSLEHPQNVLHSAIQAAGSSGFTKTEVQIEQREGYSL
jgi:hypothetical protein